MSQTILITGGSDGLGKAIAERLAPHHRLILLARSKEKLVELSERLHCEAEVCDLTDTQALKRTVDTILQRHPKVDCVINNAGCWIEGTLEQHTDEEIEHAFKINVEATIALTRLMLPRLKEQQEGLIINVISQAGLRARAERSIYGATKWAITGFTKAMQEEVSKFGIRVTGLYPGTLNTGFFERAGSNKDLSKALEPDEVARTVEFLVESPSHVFFPEIGIKNIKHGS